MSNLIITIISIALVAMMAVMGIWYGGTAFQSGQAKAAANTLITQAQQISAALNLWSVNNGGSTTFPVTSADYCRLNSVSSNLTTPGYLQQIPGQSFQSSIANGTTATFSAGSWSLITGNVNAFTTSNCNPVKVLITLFGNDSWLTGTALFPTTTAINPTALCNAINATLGITTPPTYTSGSWDWLTPLGSYPYICEFSGGTSYMYSFVYKVF